MRSNVTGSLLERWREKPLVAKNLLILHQKISNPSRLRPPAISHYPHQRFLPSPPKTNIHNVIQYKLQ